MVPVFTVFVIIVGPKKLLVILSTAWMRWGRVVAARGRGCWWSLGELAVARGTRMRGAGHDELSYAEGEALGLWDQKRGAERKKLRSFMYATVLTQADRKELSVQSRRERC